MNLKKLFLISVTFIFSIGTANADFNQKMDQMCGKIKECALEDMGDLTPEMKQMMIGMVDGMCKPMLASYKQVIGDAGLEKKASACIDSMANQSCDAMKNQNQENMSEECKEFDAAAEKAGIKLDKIQNQ